MTGEHRSGARLRCSRISAAPRCKTVTCWRARPRRTCSHAWHAPMPTTRHMRSASTTTCRGCGSCRRRRFSPTAARSAACPSPVSSTRSRTISTASSAPGPRTSGWRRMAVASAPTGVACVPSARRSRAVARPRESFPSCASWIRSPWRFRRARCGADRRPSIWTCITRRSKSSSRSASPRATSTARASICTTACASPMNSCTRCATTGRSRCAVRRDGKVLRTVNARAAVAEDPRDAAADRRALPVVQRHGQSTSWRRTSATLGLKVRQSNLCSEILLPTGRGSSSARRAPRCAACRR